MLFPYTLLPAPIALDQRAATVEEVVHELSLKTGQDLRIRPEMADEAIYLSLKPHTGPELMSLIAQATSAEWIHDGATFLARSPSFRQLRRKEELALFAAEIDRQRQPMLDETDATPWSLGIDRATAYLEGMSRMPDARTPAQIARSERKLRSLNAEGRFLSRFLRSIPAEQLAAIPLGETVRFTERPNRLQLPYPSEANFAQFLQERKAIEDDAYALPLEKRKQIVGFRPRLAGKIRTLLSVTRPLADRFAFDFRAYADQNKLSAFGSLDLPCRDLPRENDLPQEPVWKDRPLPLKGNLAAFVGAKDAESTEMDRSQLRTALLAGKDPLTLLTSAPLDILAKAMDRETILAIPDEAAADIVARLQERHRLSDFVEALRLSVTFDSTGSIVVGHARRPQESAAMKAKRPALANLVRASQTGFIDLNTVANYAANQNLGVALSHFEPTVLDAVGIGWLGHSAMDLYELSRGGRDMLRFYAALTPGQKQSLRLGRPIPIANLSPAARNAFRSALLRRSIVLSPLSTIGAEIDVTLVTDALDLTTTLETRNRSSKLVVGITEGMQTLDSGDLDEFLRQQDAGQMLGPDSGIPKLRDTLFTLGEESRFELFVRVGPGYEFHHLFLELTIPNPTTKYRLDQLPTPHKPQSLREPFIPPTR